ncbi:unnamed protein product [Diamesa hyperborea]
MFNVKAHPVQLLTFNSDDGETHFNQNIVDNLFMNTVLNDRHVVVFSIVGASRQGKSFLMNYVLRYLYSNYTSLLSSNLINPDNWLGDENEPLTGFTWESGFKRHSTGLVFWSDVFLHEQPNGEKIAIYIMDTQGLFDSLTATNDDDSRIFSLCTLLSSVQVFSLINTIQEDQFYYLNFATSIAQYASKLKTNSKPFQNLFILIRDWYYKDEYSYGLNGGNEYFKDFAMMEDEPRSCLKALKKYLPSAFDNMNCFLMPHPGKTVAQSSKYDGSWSEIDEDFLESMNELIPTLLGPKNLKFKIINGSVITASEFLIYIKMYFEQFQTGELPKAESIYDLTLFEQFRQQWFLISKCVDVYTHLFKKKEIGLCDENEIHKLHNEAESAALSFLADRKKFGSSSEHADLEKKIKKKIGTIFEHWKYVSFAEIMNLAEEIEKPNEQLRQRDLAQNMNDSTKTKLNDEVRENKHLQYEFEKSQVAIEEMLTKINALELKLFAQEEAHIIAIAKGRRKAELDQMEKHIKASKTERTLIEEDLMDKQRNLEMLHLKTSGFQIETKTLRHTNGHFWELKQRCQDFEYYNCLEQIEETSRNAKHEIEVIQQKNELSDGFIDKFLHPQNIISKTFDEIIRFLK